MKDTSPEVIAAIKEYQVPGCVSDFNENDFEQDGWGVEWSGHTPGTMMLPGGSIFLGMPTGFNKATVQDGQRHVKINIFKDWDHLQNRWSYDTQFNIPLWKHKDTLGNTIVRGACPRSNRFFLHIILGDHLDNIECLEITKDMQEGMD